MCAIVLFSLYEPNIQTTKFKTAKFQNNVLSKLYHIEEFKEQKIN